jgi:hypothetical protein
MTPPSLYNLFHLETSSIPTLKYFASFRGISGVLLIGKFIGLPTCVSYDLLAARCPTHAAMTPMPIRFAR